MFNAALAHYDFVQLPVYSFTRGYGDWVAGIYMDEFAETHGKDLPVREHLSGFIPCAGVSACFSRLAIDKMVHSETGMVFKAGALTEDYDAAFRLASLGLRPAFIAWTAPYYMDTLRGRGAPQLVRQPMTVATREHFPSGIRAAWRQRARWILGIALVGAKELGWQGSLGTRFFLARDRKGLVAIPAVMFGYVLFVAYVSVRLALHFTAPQVTGSELMASQAALWLISLSLLLALWRLAHRVYFTTRLHGWRHGLVAAPRMVVSNFVNFFAVCRAIRLYALHRLVGRPLAWDKTAHPYPDSLPSQLPSLFRPMGSGASPQSLEQAAQEELERAMASRPKR